ncbi:MAG: iron-siderophore ABC transporter substrate-binding protein [Timaviella obliquedivisa GSE-PSE-MK23-08B]|nr:iron-siderophore ABC transporter substrate-binding protein [Timaviella obliquedivisa GSE-PSE-MK23-08B]
MNFLPRSKGILWVQGFRQVTHFRVSGVFFKYFWFHLLILITLILCLVSACGNNVSSDSVSDSPLQTSDCRIVEHAMGETCVPLNPQRVVTIDPFSLENVLAFGIQPIGVAMSPDWLNDRDYLRDRLSGIEAVGNFTQPSLEKILALKPDLILGLTEDEKIYSQLTKIAPTVLFNFESSGQWKDILMHNAETLGMTDVKNQLMVSYGDRLADFKAQMGTRLQQLEVSIIRIYPNTISIYTSDTFVGSIIEDAGLARPLLQTPTGQLDISKESLQIADGDVIFLWNNESGQSQQEVQTEIAKLKADPLWQRLKAVQQGQVYEVPSYWIGSSILSANAVIDDLFKYLIEEQ